MDESTSDDQTLIAAINAGDPKAFDLLYFRHRHWTLSLATRFTGNYQDALDVTQDVFIYLAGKFPGFHLTAKMTTFLYPVVKNISLALLRRKQMSLNDDALLSQTAARPPDPPAGEQRAELAKVMASLPESQREVVLMRYVDAFTLEEISAALTIPLGTVKSRLHLALAALRTSPAVKKYFEP